MFGFLEKVAKSTVAAAITPVAVVVDTVAMPFDAVNKEAVFTRTAKAAKHSFDNAEAAIDELAVKQRK